MKVKEAMTRDVRIASPRQSILEVAKIMREVDAGFMPVRDVMTKDVLYCFDDEELDQVARNMAEQRVRRMPVVNRDKRLVGVLSIGDLAEQSANSAAEAMKGVSRPGGPHRT